MLSTTRQFVIVGLFALSLSVVPFAGQVFAQASGTGTAGSDSATGTGTGASATGTGANTGAAMTTTPTTRDEGSSNYGWLGLIGLAGLAGLMPKKTVPVTTTVHRTGDSTAR